MSKAWREVVEVLAGPDAELVEVVDRDLGGLLVANATLPDALLSGIGETTDLAWRNLAHSLGDFRLVQALESGGWTEIDEVIDQVTYVVARDPDGLLWAIGVAAAASERRGYIQSDLDYDRRDFDRVAFIEPEDALDADTLAAALTRVSE